MPPVLRDCVLVSIPKGVKDTCTSSSLKYLPIALLSKVLKRLILLKFIAFFSCCLVLSLQLSVLVC